MLTWDESMTIGLQEIDTQHKEIIAKFNAFADVLASDSLVRDDAGEMLRLLQFYAAWHFKREEDYFERFECAAAEANKQAHGQFIEYFGYFCEQWQTEAMDQGWLQDAFAELGTWIEDHMMHMDSQLRPCVIEKTTQATQEIPALIRQKTTDAAMAG